MQRTVNPSGKPIVGSNPTPGAKFVVQIYKTQLYVDEVHVTVSHVFAMNPTDGDVVVNDRHSDCRFDSCHCFFYYGV